MSNLSLQGTQEDIDHLLSTRTIRQRSKRILELTQEGKTGFSLHLEKMDSLAEYVTHVIRENYPDLKIPYHSRWNHFQAGGIDRVAGLNSKLESVSADERLKSKFDLVITSVLLDAGAGDSWRYSDRGNKIGRSEGLALASFDMFLEGSFSSSSSNPLQVDAHGLSRLEFSDFEKGFQISENNPLVGAEGRFRLLKDLAKIFGSDRRISSGISSLTTKAEEGKLRAVEILGFIQRELGPIWPDRIRVNDFNMGDVWSYPPLGAGLEGLVPFHKLSQWLSYSLIEPLEEYGLDIIDLDEMTGLPEYRNGGLFLDFGVLALKNSAELEELHPPHSERIIEWRALTVCLLDKTADLVRKKLGLSSEEFPLAKVLEGGTWAAGRKIAKEKRPSGKSPLGIQSDGTVF